MTTIYLRPGDLQFNLSSWNSDPIKIFGARDKVNNLISFQT